MPRYKRLSSSFFTIEGDQLLDASALLSGEIRLTDVTRLFASSPLDSSKHIISLRDLELLSQISAERWTPEEDLVVGVGVEPIWLEEMARKGLLVSDRDQEPFSRLRAGAEVLDLEQWHPLAALYHFMTRGAEGLPAEAIDYAVLEAQAAEKAQQFVTRYGPPPSPFHTVATSTVIDLPLIEKKGELYSLLERRKTIRSFHSSAKVTLDEMATLLQFVFGCLGYCHLTPETLLIHRTSPSGGARHPLEVYPLVLRVEKLAVGLYHYGVQDHALELMQEYDLEEAKALAVEIAGGQAHAGSAHILFIMTARFYRNYWKYRRNSRTYSIVLMDAAHLSQTFYMVSADLNLGTFFSAAIDAPRTDEILKLDGYREGSIAVCGCGVKPPAGVSDHSLPFRRYVPRKTKL